MDGPIFCLFLFSILFTHCTPYTFYYFPIKIFIDSLLRPKWKQNSNFLNVQSVSFRFTTYSRNTIASLSNISLFEMVLACKLMNGCVHFLLVTLVINATSCEMSLILSSNTMWKSIQFVTRFIERFRSFHRKITFSWAHRV